MDKILAERQRLLGDEQGYLFRSIETDLYNLRIQWRVFTALFGYSKERVDLLNSASGTVAHYVEKSILEATILGICRLTDPAGKGAFKNISVIRLRDLFVDERDVEDFDKLIADLDEKCRFARLWRNKRLAHSDDYTRRNIGVLDTATPKKVNDCLDGIAAVLKFVASKRMDVHLCTHPISHIGSDEVQFLKAMYDGVLAREQRKPAARELISKGKYDEAKEALRYPSWVTYRPEEPLD